MTQPRRLTAVLAAAAALVVSLVPIAVFAAEDGTSDGSRADLVVNTDKGHVKGTLKGDIREFVGIPYAAPPVGDLRWQPAQPHARWHGVLDATQFGSPCPQVGGLFGPSSTNEDCLFLNVYTPAGAVPPPPAALGTPPTGRGRVERLPVMLWIHGGALVSGAGSQYNPSDLVRQGVIVVTINYRLGELGFLAHAALAASPGGPSGDYGLTDQQEAMRWVQRNIARFGGAPGNVTIFGESAGGLSVHSQLASPLAHGLFAKAITESGAYSVVQQSLAQAEAAGGQYAASVGCPGQTASCLRSLSVATLLSKQGGIVNPNIDGRVLTQSIATAFASGQFNRVPVIEGTNHDEWALFVALTEFTTGHPLAAADYVAAIEQTVFVPQPVAQFLATKYPLSSFGGNPSLALTALGTDAIFACNARRSLLSMSKFVSAFQYEFSDENAPSAFKASFPLGAYHAAELQYLFTAFGGPLTPAQRRLAATMRSYWTEFAKHGSPNSEDTPHWPHYSATTERLQSLVPPAPVTASGFAAEHQCTLWRG
jgi:para-nitrobenzyl esterase